MADDIIVDQQQAASPARTEAQVQLDQAMAIALNGGMPPQAQQQAAPTTEDATAAQALPAAPVDYFSTIKEKFGYNTHEDAITEIEQLRAFKAAPPIKELEFENEDSKRFFQAAVKGDRKTTYEILHREQQLDRYLSAEVTADTAADIVKLGMQLKYESQKLSQAEIDYKFKKTFAVPPKPIQDMAEEPEDFNLRLSAWQEIANEKQMELVIEAKLAKPELEAAKNKLVFPEIVSNEDEGYVQYKKALEQQTQLQADQAKVDAEIVAAFNAITSKDLEKKLTFIDEPNKINFEFQFEPHPERLAKAQKVNTVEAFQALFTNSDGTLNRKGFLRAVYYAQNEDEVIREAINQGKNAAIKATLPDNSQGGVLRQLPNMQEPSELHKQMQQAGIVQ